MTDQPWKIKLASLDKRIKAFGQGYRQNIALLDNDPDEISYLIQNYLQENKSPDITYIQATTTYVGKPEFFKAVCFSLLSDYLNRQDSLDNLINTASVTLGATTDFIKKSLNNGTISFANTLEVINKFITESHRHCILFIEEFLELRELFGNFYDDFSKFIMLQRNCMIVLTSATIKDAERALSAELNLLFGNFEKIFLNENNSLDKFLYLGHLLNPLNPSPFFLSFFISILGSGTIYYDQLTKAITKNYDPNNEIDSIINAVNDTLYPQETYFFQKFIKKIDALKFSFKDFPSILRLLFSLSDGYLRKGELSSLGIYNSNDTNSRLQKLLDLNYIENLGNIYKIKDPLFSFWLAQVFKLRFSPSVLNPRQRNVIFKKNLEQKISLFKDSFFKDKLKKVLQLFACFKDDNLCLGKTRYSLPTINNSKIISYPKRNFHLLVCEGKEIIFAGIKERDVVDNDIFDFIEKGANIKGKKVKKIFISLDKLPPTARVIAKNNKLLIWDVNEVNRLLNVYNQPMVSCKLAE